MAGTSLMPLFEDRVGPDGNWMVGNVDLMKDLVSPVTGSGARGLFNSIRTKVCSFEAVFNNCSVSEASNFCGDICGSLPSTTSSSLRIEPRNMIVGLKGSVMFRKVKINVNRINM